jgi:3-mercaptopyruvate sulfurtransferase SseA/sterol desaturase/sphingolipid hydroxylase (fatty acid hydroxylase superfamily)
MSYLYPIALLLISAFVAALERLRPFRPQKQLRPMLWSDLIHILFNGHFLGVLIYGLATNWVLPPIDRLLGQHGLTTHVYRNLATTWPLWLQIVVVIVVLDFVQWCVHNLLHRVSWLWEFHKVHHSVVDGEMDWIVSFRFQFVEVLVYKSFQYLPLAFFGFRPEPILVHAIFGTLIGHLNHANLDFTYGPLRYVLNSPRMHLWHHYYEGDSKTTINYGIILSVWDWIFRTGHIPKDPPPKLGFPGVEDFPKDFFSQTIWPLQRLLPASLRRGYLPAALGLLTLTGFYFVHLPPQKRVPANLVLAGESLAASQPTLTEQPPGTYAKDAAEADAALLRFGEEARAAGYAHPEHLVSVSELARALGSRRLVLLDLRPGDRSSAGRIPQAQAISPADYIEKEPLPGLLRSREHLQGLLRSRGVKEDSVVVLYGDGGPEAFRFFWALQVLGSLEARVLDGGLLAWKAAGHPVAGGAPRAAAPGDVTLRGQDGEVPLRWAQIEPFLQGGPDGSGGQGALLLDSRSKDEYTGARQHPEAARGGHIPGAVNLEWTQVVRGEKDPRLLPPAELRARFAPHKVERRARIITTCQSGNRSAALYFALLQIGVPRERILNYNGSWAEYSRLNLPVHTGDQP